MLLRMYVSAYIRSYTWTEFLDPTKIDKATFKQKQQLCR